MVKFINEIKGPDAGGKAHGLKTLMDLGMKAPENPA